jgi:hypothetical protein
MNTCNECGKDNINNLKYCRWCGYELPKVNVEEKIEPVSKPQKKTDYKKIVISSVVGGIAFLAAYFLMQFLVQQVFFGTPCIEKVMMQVTSKFNKVTPVMLDSDTRADSAVFVPPNILQYHFTLVNVKKEEFDTPQFLHYMKPHIVNQIRTNPEMEFLRSQRIIFEYHYSDKYGNHIATIVVTPEQYK